jgi:hypothetical protein
VSSAFKQAKMILKLILYEYYQFFMHPPTRSSSLFPLPETISGSSGGN